MTQTRWNSRFGAGSSWQRCLFTVSLAVATSVAASACVIDKTTSIDKEEESPEMGTGPSSGSNSGTMSGASNPSGVVTGGNTSAPGSVTTGGGNTMDNGTATDSTGAGNTMTGGGATGGTGENGSSNDGSGSGSEPAPAWKGDNFENGRGQWEMKEGVWEIGSPTALEGPKPLSGTGVAGTVLKADYPGSNTARKYSLVSPEFVIPADGEMPRVRYNQWFELNKNDSGRTLIKVEGVAGDSNEGGGRIWQHTVAGSSENIWGQSVVYFDKKYVGRKAQIIFELISSDGRTGPGWFIDDIAVETGAPKLDNGGFEQGWNEWSVEGSIWNIGVSTDPKVPKPRGGKNFAGTVLGGNYPTNFSENGATARLATPKFRVPAGSSAPKFRFYEWYSLASQDRGMLQIRVEDSGKSWTIVPNSEIRNRSGEGWKQRALSLDAYKGKIVQIGFLFKSYDGRTSSGWFIDDVTFDLK